MRRQRADETSSQTENQHMLRGTSLQSIGDAEAFARADPSLTHAPAAVLFEGSASLKLVEANVACEAFFA